VTLRLMAMASVERQPTPSTVQHVCRLPMCRARLEHQCAQTKLPNMLNRPPVQRKGVSWIWSLNRPGLRSCWNYIPRYCSSDRAWLGVPNTRRTPSCAAQHTGHDGWKQAFNGGAAVIIGNKYIAFDKAARLRQDCRPPPAFAACFSA